MRIQQVLIPLLRADPRLDGVTINSWVPDVDYRKFPMVMVRRVGGTRNPKSPGLHMSPVAEIATYTTSSLIECEEIYETVLDVLYDAVENQTPTDAGCLQSMYETMGATQFSSLFQDSWRVQGLIRFCVRRPRISD